MFLTARILGYTSNEISFRSGWNLPSCSSYRWMGLYWWRTPAYVLMHSKAYQVIYLHCSSRWVLVNWLYRIWHAHLSAAGPYM
jgi:hypothetical protein